MFASSTDLQAEAAAALCTLAANGNVTATEQLPLATQPTNKCAPLARLRECSGMSPERRSANGGEIPPGRR